MRNLAVDPRDVALMRTFPLTGVPRYGVFHPLSENGQRLLIAENGYFLEVRRNWLYALQECAVSLGAIRFPFGIVKPIIQLAFGKLPRLLIEEFIEIARLACPNEVAAVIVFDIERKMLSLRLCNSQTATATHIRYEIPELNSDEVIVADIHSHGVSKAQFSVTDDIDDAGATRLALVVGKVNAPAPEVTARLCLNGLFIPLRYHLEKASEKINAQDEYGEIGIVRS